MFKPVGKPCIVRKLIQEVRCTLASSSESKINCNGAENRRIFDPRELLLDPYQTHKSIFLGLQRQAKMSVLLHVGPVGGPSTERMYDYVHEYCSKRGDVLSLTRLPVTPGTNLESFIVEFGDTRGVENLSVVSGGGLLLPIAKLAPKQRMDVGCEVKPNTGKLCADFKKRIENAENMSQQIQLFYEEHRISSPELRKKLHFCSVIGDFFNWHMNTTLTPVPYGSTVPGFTWNKADIDVCLTNLTLAKKRGNQFVSVTQLASNAKQRFQKFERDGAISLFTKAGDEIHQYIKGLTHVEVVDTAATPIMVLNYAPLGLFIDISLENRVGLKLSWTLNMYARLEPRVGPFLFLVREWAKQRGVAQSGLGAKTLTPFMVTCLGLFYLMRVHPPVVVPMLDLLSNSPSSDDLVFGGIRFQTKTDLASLALHDNTQSLEELFLGFLQYYAKLDFANCAINLTYGKTMGNKRPSISIISPFSEGKNISKNKGPQQAKSLQMECDKTLRSLESKTRRGRRNKDWGLSAVYRITESMW